MTTNKEIQLKNDIDRLTTEVENKCQEGIELSKMSEKTSNKLIFFSGINVATLYLFKYGYPIATYFLMSSITITSVYFVITVFRIFKLRRNRKEIDALTDKLNVAIDEMAQMYYGKKV